MPLNRYNSTSYLDDMAWAATWMYVATGTITYLEDAYNYWTMHRNVSSAAQVVLVVRAHATSSCDIPVALSVTVSCCARIYLASFVCPASMYQRSRTVLSTLTQYPVYFGSLSSG